MLRLPGQPARRREPLRRHDRQHVPRRGVHARRRAGGHRARASTPGEPVTEDTSRLGDRPRAQGPSAPAHAARGRSTRSRTTRSSHEALPAEFVRDYVAMKRRGVGGVPRRGLALGGRPLPVQRLSRGDGHDMRVLYVNPMDGEVNPAIDAIALRAAALARRGRHRDADALRRLPRSRTASARDRRRRSAPAWPPASTAIALLRPRPRGAGRAASPQARAAGIPVFTFVRPLFDVNAPGAVPQLQPRRLHGRVALPTACPTAPGSAIIGGPDTPDDAEEVAGLLYTFRRRRRRRRQRPDRSRTGATSPTWRRAGPRSPAACSTSTTRSTPSCPTTTRRCSVRSRPSRSGGLLGEVPA